MIRSCAQRTRIALIAVMAVIVAACSTQVTRMDSDTVKDLSGRWNDTDSRLVSEQMIGEMLDGGWTIQHARATGMKPSVIVGTVRNLSDEHINVQTFVNDIERAMINSGRVTFVASAEERGAIRDERKDQELNASEASRKAMGHELGADYMLGGTINTINDQEGRTAVRYYQIDLDLISLKDNTKVWVGQKKIKKLVEKPAFRL